MPDQTPSMPPLPGALLPLIRGAAQCTGPAEDVQMAYITAEIHAYAKAVADERVREALAGVLEALEAGHDALAAAATDYHTTMAGYRPHMHAAMDAEVASVKVVLERVRALAISTLSLER
ncbi:MAG: hypothetical protein DI587_17220 [Variovorax paradoxus]|nr:MAG: hypothetical protein DI583_17220 [Variovorax paradoxus]PZQ08976.1 MAG: hypothetical protein DI587_17220 [Variovorax paradoxus]